MPGAAGIWVSLTSLSFLTVGSQITTRRLIVALEWREES